jgi:hypothetical protein
MLARLKTDLAALCALFVEGHRRHHGKGKHWWEALSWIVINKRPLLSPFPQAERRDIYIADFFPATNPRPVTPGKKCSSLIFGTDDDDWRTDYEQSSSTQWNGITELLKGKNDYYY